MTVTQGSVLSHIGKVRSNNQDSAYCGRHLFVVADGMGGHAGGDVASAITVNQLVELDRSYETPDEALQALSDGVLAANEALISTVYQYPELAGMGTTCSGFIVVGDKLALVHIGDSRIYVWRDGTLNQVTKDHTFVQKLVDAGRITPEEAAIHPRRNVVMRVLGDVDMEPTLDVAIVDAHPGDRWLLCSDGLSGVVLEKQLTDILAKTPNRDRAASRLLKAALDNGAPDNVTAVLVDTLVDSDEPTEPRIVGSADSPLAISHVSRRTDGRTSRLSSLRLSTRRTRSFEPTQYESADSDYLEAIIAEDHSRAVRRRVTAAVLTFVLVAALILGALLGYRWTQTQYYVGVQDDQVVIYNGISQNIGPIVLHHQVDMSALPSVALDSLPYDSRVAVERNIAADSLDDAQRIVEQLAEEAGTG